MKTVIEAFDRYPTNIVRTKVIKTFLSLLLKFFTSSPIFYLQIMEWVMDTICTPVYANIFMRQLKNNTCVRTLKRNQRNQCCTYNISTKFS